MNPEYRQTEVGAIPEDWAQAPLGEVAPLQRGFDLPSSQIRPGPHPVVYSNGVLKHHHRSMVKGPGVVTGRSGTIGSVHFVQRDYWPHNTSLWVTSFCGNDPKFIYYLYSHVHLTGLLSGSGVPTLNRNDVHEQIVAHPTIAEQRAIAEALSDADALIESLEQLLTKKRQIKKGAMQELLTGRKRLPGFSGEWEERALFDLAGGSKELFDDGDWIESEHITNEGIRLVQTGNIGVGCFIERCNKKYIFEESFVSLRCKEIRRGDLLICRLADPAGRACVLPEIGETKIITSVDVTIFRPPASVANRVFLANTFSTDQWFRAVSNQSGGTTHKRISRGALGRLKIRVPLVEEQTAIATILSDMDAEITALEAKLSKARQLKQGMMQELLTGRIRLL